MVALCVKGLAHLFQVEQSQGLHFENLREIMPHLPGWKER